MLTINIVKIAYVYDNPYRKDFGITKVTKLLKVQYENTSDEIFPNGLQIRQYN